MIPGLDSAIPPTPAQAQAAARAGVKLWNGYLSEIPQRDGIYRPWSKTEFDVVRVINPKPIAFFSGWDDPVAIRQTAKAWNVRPCLDVERLIRDDGLWVQGVLDASGAGLYGVRSVHVGRRAAFHIAALYPGSDPQRVYPAGWDGTGPCGWQWLNTHTEFGVGVDRGWYDDWFLGNPVQEDVMTFVIYKGATYVCTPFIKQHVRDPQHLVGLQAIFGTAQVVNWDDPNQSQDWHNYVEHAFMQIPQVPNDPPGMLDLFALIGQATAIKAELDALRSAPAAAAPSYQGTVTLTPKP